VGGLGRAIGGEGEGGFVEEAQFEGGRVSWRQARCGVAETGRAILNAALPVDVSVPRCLVPICVAHDEGGRRLVVVTAVNQSYGQ